MDVESIKDHRYNDSTEQWELRVAWKGLEEIEYLRETIQDLQRDTPVMVREYVAQHGTQDLIEFIELQ
ncbi:TPA: hypothetical protein N0F65_010570 [Lagenidium giganteum]|uniref:Chromo domain-containing protein n=1 Tax=Lagenidium giganteum TaxID=4803 RepID=A0AAV2ZEN0_9STRA|nr:TPA: hypothetical protein N0F65_010570 [Lagenidium giganteum]